MTIIHKMDFKEKKEFLHNIDLLAIHSEREVYKKATQENIQEIVADMGVFNEDGQKFSMASSIQDFKKFGPGLYLMFKFLKMLSIIFGVLALFSLIQIFILLKSPYYQGYEGIVRMNLLRLTIASIEPETHQTYIFFDFFITLIFLVFLVWWKQSEQRIVESCNAVYKLPSYLAVQLRELPENYSEEKIKQFLERDGDLNIEEIYTARYFEEKLEIYQKITKLANQFRLHLELSEAEASEQSNQKQIKTMLQKFFELETLYHQIRQQKFNESKFQSVKAFIVFRYYAQRERALERYSLANHIWNHKQEEFKCILEPCQVQPGSIAWENIGYPKFKKFVRRLLVFLLLGLLTCFGVILIFVLEILETAAIGDVYYFSEKDMVKKAEDQDYCVSLSPISFLQESNICKQFTPDYFKLAILIILVPITIFVCKKTIMFSLSHLVHFCKYDCTINWVKTQIVAISFFYFIVVGALHLVLYLKAKNQSNTLSLYQVLYPIIQRLFSLTNYNPASIHLYSDFSFDWYKQATFFIVLIASTSFNISNIWKLLISSITKKVQIYQAHKQKTIYRVREKLKGIQLHMEDVYSSAIVISLFTFLYFTAIPLVLLLGFVSMTVLFWVCKFVFVKKSESLPKMSHSVNHTVANILMFALIIHCVMAPIYLGAPGIGVVPESYKQKYDKTQGASEGASANKTMTIGERYQTIGIYYLIIIALIVAYYCLKKPIKKLLSKYLNKNKEQNHQTNSYQFKITEFKGLYPSYSMHNNKKYAQNLKVVYLMNKAEAKRGTCVIDTGLQAALDQNKSLHSKKCKSYRSGVYECDIPLFERIVEILEKQCGIKLYGTEVQKDGGVLSEKMILDLKDMFKAYDSYESSQNIQTQLNEGQTENNKKYQQKGTMDKMMNQQERQENVCEQVEDEKVEVPAHSGSRLNSEQI